ncbi:MAG: biopolymer transporter ExbD [Spirulinaceae cyanobacterium RM2_2_10]|nr:biopolymer transporter ExbD [Spirulinaceae cyanobacterium SM2_1_0]NJO20702.1 biopolymer transporter ExbD [Spirulinaceae cyanobacterium RM2_2_10]
MRFRHQREATMPVVDLIPMLNVMMGVLAFFVAVSMTLAEAPDGVDVELPSGNDNQPVNTAQLPPNLLLARALAEGTIEVAGEQLSQDEFLARVEQHLATAEDAEAVLIANPDVVYEEVIQILAMMREVGGDRVSLGVESN